VTISTIGGFGLIFPPAQVLDLPYILRDDRVAECFFDGPFLADLRKAVTDKHPKLRLMMVGNTGGWRNFMTTKTQIKEPSDIVGQKIRTIPADIQKEMVKMLGGNPTPISWPEVYTSLATGVVEGTKNGITDIVSMKFHEHLRYATLDGHAYMAAFWWMNNDFWNELSHEDKVIVNDGFYHMMWETRQSPKSGAIAAYQEFKKAGGTVYKPTPKQKQMFVDATKGMYKWYENQFGPEWLNKVLAETKVCEAKIDAASASL
jgi:TRAP-type C4-dicarboxylate transport system substrate-binding protein